MCILPKLPHSRRSLRTKRNPITTKLHLIQICNIIYIQQNQKQTVCIWRNGNHVKWYPILFIIYRFKGQGYLNDFWEFDVTTNQWTWISGSQLVNQTAMYTEKGVPHADNTPSGRFGGCLWEDLNHHIWLFGGYGNGPISGIGMLFRLCSVKWKRLSGRFVEI